MVPEGTLMDSDAQTFFLCIMWSTRYIWSHLPIIISLLELLGETKKWMTYIVGIKYDFLDNFGITTLKKKSKYIFCIH